MNDFPDNSDVKKFLKLADIGLQQGRELTIRNYVSRTRSTKDAISILSGAVKHLTDRLDRAEMASEELRERIDQAEKVRIG